MHVLLMNSAPITNYVQTFLRDGRSSIFGLEKSNKQKETNGYRFEPVPFDCVPTTIPSI